ncbi:CGNR zinc finger domain-containing protein [Cohnella nanjingensis]|uniref:ABATE domain-containing protein n=1 Tax=Cohnella nanjingensis TaxID=1387779 RepID=A0A7X0RW84_9BACL|nr:ABATE domain-containing protein [Cohnella nanjingensis]MBB6674802.1 ABATE domain-containing protein [Cohnella nanjingensis]
MRLWIDFANSECHDWRGSGVSEDWLTDPAWVEEWLRRHELPPTAYPTPDELRRLKQLRYLILRMVSAYASESVPGPEDLIELNRFLAEGMSIRSLTASDGSYRVESLPAGRDWRQIRAEIAASFAATLSEGEPRRIRICDNSDCMWVYYDDTRNRSKRFCDDKLCGNLIKVRRFRARKKAIARGLSGTEELNVGMAE